MKRIIVLLIGVFLSTGYPWVKIYDGWKGYCVRQTTDGGYIVSGYINDSLGNSAECLIKTDSEGDTLWVARYYFPKGGIARCVRETTDNGYIFVGSTYAKDGLGDLLLVKTDEYGDTLWTKAYGRGWEDVGYWVEQTSDGGYVVSGRTEPSGMGWEMWLLKTDEYGDTMWTQIYTICSHGICVQETKDNGYVIATNYVLIKTDSLGDTLWTNSVGAASVRQTTDEGYIMATNHYADVWIIKTDSVGDTVWTKTYGGADEDWCYDVEQTLDGGYIVVGETHSFATVPASNVWLLKTDAQGDTLWTRVLEPGIGRSVQQTSDGGYIITGRGAGLLLIKTDSLGYAGVEEPPVPVTHSDWEVISPIGPHITLRYTDRPQGFHATIYDLGRELWAGGLFYQGEVQSPPDSLQGRTD
jgi:hypothetical protein